MTIQGIAGMDAKQIRHEVARGGRFVVFQYAVSALVITFRRSTDVYFVRGGESPVLKGLPWTLLSLFAGWWGFPWGLIYTPMVLFKNLGGGTDVTAAVLGSFAPPASPAESSPNLLPPPLPPRA